MGNYRARTILGAYAVSLMVFGCTPSMTAAMSEQHTQMVASSNQEIAAARADVARSPGAGSAEAFVTAVASAATHETRFLASWTQKGAEGSAPVRSDVPALTAEAARYVNEAVAREPNRSALLLTHLGEMYAAALDPAHAAAAFERALADGFNHAAFEGYLAALDRLGRHQDVKDVCKRESSRQAAQPAAGTVFGPTGERRMTPADLRYPFLAACVLHGPEATVEVVLDWASATDRALFIERDTKDRASNAAAKAKESRRGTGAKER